MVAALNAVQPYDWAAFLRTRLDTAGGPAPLDGLKRGGYRLIYTDKPSDMFQAEETEAKTADFTFSVGMALDKDGVLKAIEWDGAAFKAGLTAGVKVLAVNGEPYDPDALKDAIRAAKGSAAPLELIVRTADRFKVVRIDYHGGLRYPHLERDAAQPARLDAILNARK